MTTDPTARRGRTRPPRARAASEDGAAGGPARTGVRTGPGAPPGGRGPTRTAAPPRTGIRVFGRVLVAVLATVALLVLPGPGTGGATAEALSVCQGRPAKTVSFATGELRLYRTRHYVCAVTVAKRPGTRRPMSVSLQPRGGRPAVRAGRFDRQAGPVTVHALNRCVRASGWVAGRGAGTGWTLC